MRLALVIALACLVGAVMCIEKNQVRFRQKSRERFQHFQEKHGRKSFNKHEEARRFELFAKQDEMIEEHNEKYERGEVSYKMGHNFLSDLDAEEREQYGGVLLPDHRQKRAYPEDYYYQPFPQYKLSGKAIPSEIDWRDIWKVGVRNQGGCGSCWTFGTAGAIEAGILAACGMENPPDVSEQYFLDCAYFGSNKCRGGWPPHASRFAKQVGYVLESESPYAGQNRSCPYKASNGASIPIWSKVDPTIAGVAAANKGPAVTEVYQIPPSSSSGGVKNTVDLMKDALVNMGVLMVCLNANPKFDKYTEGVFFYDTTADMSGCTHAVLIVGYGTDSATRKDYWIIRNSWGPERFGDQGYMYMDRSTTGALIDMAYVLKVSSNGCPNAGARPKLPPNPSIRRWAQLKIDAAKAREDEKKTGVFDSDAAIAAFGSCKTVRDNGLAQGKDYCSGGWQVANLDFYPNCCKTCDNCVKKKASDAAGAAREAEKKTGCYDSDEFWEWCAKQGASYCGGTVTGASGPKQVNTECKKTCKKCTSG